jgi:hypothetical protein
VVEPIDISAVKAALVKWVKDSTGLTTIWSNQNAPRPAYPYAYLGIVSAVKAVSDSWVEQQYLVEEPEPGEELMVVHWVPCSFSVSVGVCGDNADLSVLKAEAALQSWAVQEALDLVNVAFINAMSTVPVYRELGKEYREEIQKEFKFGAMLESTTYASFIEEVTVSSESLGVEENISAP